MTLVGYYAEINGVSIAILLLLLWQIQKRETGQHTAKIVLKGSIWVVVAMCISDFFAAFFRGRIFAGARPIIESFNIMFLVSGTLVCFLWLWYVVVMTCEGHISNLHFAIIIAPAGLMILTLLLNPLTHFYFTIDEKNCYNRGQGIVFHWIVTILYIGAATIVSIVNSKRTINPLKKATYRSLALFAVPSFVAAVIQWIFYGLTTIQVGMVVSLLLIFLESETSQASKDAMTGINNRRALNQFIYSQFEKSKVFEMAVMTININEYRAINDVYGHLEGDEAVRVMSGILSNVIGTVSERVGLYRFGNAEFIITGSTISDVTFAEISRKMREKLDNYNLVSSKHYALSASTGISRGLISCMEDFEKVLKNAQEKSGIDKR